jgi:hypothetical protein
MAETTKVKKAKLDMLKNGPSYIATVQGKCRKQGYDVALVMAELNCSRPDALAVIALTEYVEGNKKSK